jgi:lipopolysaccharide export system permease protein
LEKPGEGSRLKGGVPCVRYETNARVAGSEDVVFGSILHRMILWELTKVFFIALVGITGILLMAGIVAEASQQGLGPAQILAAIPLLIPSTLPYTIPATTLFAACVVYGRLAADNEILAIRAAGINILKVVKPGLYLGIVMGGVTMGLYYRIIPYTHMLLRSLVFNDAEELMYSLLKQNNGISHSSMPYSMFVSGVKGRKLLNPVFKHRNKAGEIDGVVQARDGELRVNVARKLLLVRMHHCTGTSSDDGSRVDFEDHTWEVDLPDDWLKKKDRRARDMTWQEMLARKRELQDLIERDNVEIVSTRETLANGGNDTLEKHLKSLKARVGFNKSQIVVLDVELNMRPALSLGCLCFILAGCPVGIWFSRSDFLSSFITCFLPIVFVYYPLVLCGTGLAKEGRYNLFTMVWGADIFMGLVGLVLFWRLLRN